MLAPYITAQSLTRWAAHRINENSSFLPNVSFEVYTFQPQTKNTSQHLAAANALIDLQVDLAITATDEDSTISTSENLSYHNVLTLSINSTTSLFTSKSNFHYLLRTSPSDYYLCKTFILLLREHNISNVAYLYTPDGYGIASANLFQQLANESSIEVLPIQAALTRIPDGLCAVRSVIVNVDITVLPLHGAEVQRWLGYSGCYGTSYLYIFANNSFRLTNYPDNPNFAEGSLYVVPQELVNSSQTFAVQQEWAQSNRTMFPGSSNPSSWQGFDAVYAFAYALNELFVSGKMPNLVSTSEILQSMLNFSAPAMSGTMVFAASQDRLPIFSILNVVTNYPYNTKHVATMDWVTTTLSYTDTPISYYNGSTQNPGTVQRSWDICNFQICNSRGNCSADLKCVCFQNYTGEYCDQLIPISPNSGYKSDYNPAYIIPVIVIVALLLITGLIVVGWLYFRRRRRLYEFVKQVTSRQGTEVSRSEFQLHQQIGYGASGEVFKGVFRGTVVAIKRMAVNKANSFEEFQLETSTMCALRHPNIVLFMASCFDIANNEMFLIMEYMQQGSLYNVLHNSKIAMSYDLQVHIAAQAALGLNFLHESTPSFVHRDMKSHNILLDDSWNARISDFGITRIKELTTNSQNKTGQSMGTIFWCAPEVLEDPYAFSAKSDCYSFGIVLYEIFHRKNPYDSQDPMAVAVDVLRHGARPCVDPSCPEELRALMQDCWAQNPNDRPNMKQILLRLRALAVQFPLADTSTIQLQLQTPHAQPSQSPFYLVHTEIQGANSLWDTNPRIFQSAVALHNQHVRQSLEIFEGLEENFDIANRCAFSLSFSTLQTALNWCVAVQISLMRLTWPADLLQIPEAAEVRSDSGELMWRGPRVRMAIHAGFPICETNKLTGHVTYSGIVADKAKQLLSLKQHGSIVVSSAVMQEILYHSNFIEGIEVEGNIPGEADSITQILPASLVKRAAATAAPSSLPHMVIKMEEDPDACELQSMEKKWVEFSLSDLPRPAWLIRWEDLAIHSLLGKGPIWDSYRAKWNRQDVVVKALANQNIRESELIELVGNVAIVSKMSHPNVLPVHALCVDQGHICIVVEFMRKGTLAQILADEQEVLPLLTRVHMARDIALGMDFLSSHPDPSIRLHGSFNSSNILVSSTREIKIGDYAQAHLQDLARTLTSVHDVIWTAPEVLEGATITPRSSLYSFGIMLWSLLTRKVPFEGSHPMKVVAEILRGARPNIPEDCPPFYHTLMEGCWNKDPEHRPSWQVLVTELNHFISDLEGS